MIVARTLGALLLFFYINSALAIDLQDSTTWNPQLDAALKVLDFDQSFACGSAASFKELVGSCDIGCDRDVCWSSCMSPTDPPPPAPRTVVNCTPDSFGVLATATGGYYEVQKTEFATTQGRPLNFVLNRLQELIHAPAGTTFKISRITDKPYIIRRGTPTETSLPALQIEGAVIFPGHTGGGVETVFTVLKDGPGVARIARLRTMSESWFLLDDIQ